MVIVDDDAPGTLGAMLDAGWRMYAHCRASHCWRDLDADLVWIVELFGPDAALSDRTFAGVVCRRCRGRTIHWIFRAPVKPLAGGAHGRVWIEALPTPVVSRETEFERARRLATAAADEAVTTPGLVQSMDSPDRPPKSFTPGPLYVRRLLVRAADGYYWRREWVRPYDFAAMGENDRGGEGA